MTFIVGQRPIVSTTGLVLLLDSTNPRCVIGYNPSTYVPALQDLVNIGSSSISVTNVHYQPNPRELYFDGTDQLSFSSNANYNSVFATGGTVVIFLRVHSSGPENNGRVIGKSSDGAEFNSGWWINIPGASSAPCAVTFMRAGNTGYGLWQTTGTPLSLLTNHMIMLTYNDSSYVTPPSIWVDGQLQTITTTHAPTTSPVNDNSQNIQIGNGLTLARGFDGWLDCVMVYKRVLSTLEMKYILAANADKYKINVQGQF